jgi:hypothetical protein
MNSSQRRCASSTRSSNGRCFALEKDLATLMARTYSELSAGQAVNSHLALPTSPLA